MIETRSQAHIRRLEQVGEDEALRDDLLGDDNPQILNILIQLLSSQDKPEKRIYDVLRQLSLILLQSFQVSYPVISHNSCLYSVEIIQSLQFRMDRVYLLKFLHTKFFPVKISS